MYPLHRIFPLYLVPDNKRYNGFTSLSFVLSPKKSQPIKYNTTHVAHFTTDTPRWLCVPFQLPITPLNLKLKRHSISANTWSFSFIFWGITPYSHTIPRPNYKVCTYDNQLQKVIFSVCHP